MIARIFFKMQQLVPEKELTKHQRLVLVQLVVKVCTLPLMAMTTGSDGNALRMAV
ncbi:hypothetical protein OK016_02425 [Vibrio chagasii]|nr:hypothetical protein [Vibrio chagasii]